MAILLSASLGAVLIEYDHARPYSATVVAKRSSSQHCAQACVSSVSCGPQRCVGVV